MTDVLGDFYYCLSVLLSKRMVMPGALEKCFCLTGQLFLVCYSKGGHPSTGMYLFAEKTRVSHLETREGRNCITP